VHEIKGVDETKLQYSSIILKTYDSLWRLIKILTVLGHQSCVWNFLPMCGIFSLCQAFLVLKNSGKALLKALRI
jgi:hypothetical protein